MKKLVHDLKGREFGYWKVIEIVPNTRPTKWLCKCQCGKVSQIVCSKLLQGLTKSCGCKKQQIMWDKRFVDLSGQRFGNLIVIKATSEKIGSSFKWECKCDCGNKVNVISAKLKNGHTKSCGCLKIIKKSHNKSKHRIYKIWQGMMKRCYNHNSIAYYNYGGRGIKVCERWHKFENFYNDVIEKYRDRLSLDRYPNTNGDYEPSNFRWATAKQQSENRRNTVYLTIDGIKKTLMEWSRESNINHNLIRRRLKTWSDIKKAVYTPSRYLHPDTIC